MVEEKLITGELGESQGRRRRVARVARKRFNPLF